ncbi:YciI family protein [Pseudomaricurvus alkylphenolicus]|jgi:hypothetical protein|uniref:YciI family protein n=1 Tax=Pseudomaricurvus alkylphenolicus TaxID=1306991 RepID=UPI0014225BA8|nr:YciI family protein [Pseudomaricurvus alkylphenolicus]NIB41752.1 YciI family protein [Pseudomaricurvus alkylphenolicus]
MQYSLLIYGSEGIYERLCEEEQQQIMQGHYDLQAVLAERGEFSSAKLMSTTSAVTLQPTQAVAQPALVKDGPFAETKERLLGFYTFECDTLDDAIELANKLSSPYVRLEVRPVDWAGGVLAGL